MYDVRTQRELASLVGHGRDVTAAAWHPWAEEVVVSGGFDGTILYWLISRPEPQARLALSPAQRHAMCVEMLCRAAWSQRSLQQHGPSAGPRHAESWEGATGAHRMVAAATCPSMCAVASPAARNRAPQASC